MSKVIVGKSQDFQYILGNKLNQHGMIAGATGTGKTVTLKVLLEELASLGVPTIVSDVKGDIANLSKVGQPNEKIQERLEELGIIDFQFQNYSLELWDPYGERGMPLRISISELGPLLLSQVLELNETQQSILHILFHLADEEELLLVDLKDLMALLQYLNQHRRELSKKYGSISANSVSAIIRKVFTLQEEGGDDFFGAPSIEIKDLIRKDEEGFGIINILDSQKLVNRPMLYSIFLLYLLSQLFEELPEVGNPEVPKLVFFFDEAHLLFDLPKNVVEKLETVVRLIRSKGVGIFFVTQNPLDINDKISSQLATKIIHQLRAFSPKEVKAIQAISSTLRENEHFETKEEITNLRTGEALFTTLDEEGMPTPVEKIYILPPHSSFDILVGEDYDYLVKNSSLYRKYYEEVDPISAFEILQEKFRKQSEAEEMAAQREEEEKRLKAERKEYEKARKGNAGYLNKGIDSFIGSMSRAVGRELARGLMGSLRKRR